MLPGRRITAYVLRELTTPTLLGLFLYMFLLLMQQFFLIAEKSLAKNLGLELTLQMFLVVVPKLLVLAIPMAILLGTLIAVGRLSADHEWVALQSAGCGPGALLRPIVLHGLVGALAGFLVYAIAVPRSNYVGRSLRGELYLASNLASDVRPRQFYELPEGAILFVDDIRAGSERTLDGVLVIQKPPGSTTTELTLARTGDLYPAADRSGTLHLDLYDGVFHAFAPEAGATHRYAEHFDTIRKNLHPAAYLKTLLDPPDKSIQDLPMGELWQAVSKAQEDRRALARDPAPDKVREFEVTHRHARATVELHQRIALPLASVFFAILALPLGITRVRSGKGAGLAMSLLVILVYRITFVLARNQSVAGTIPAVVGPWAGNAVIAVWAAVALWRMRYRSADERGWLAALGERIGRLGSAVRRRRGQRDAADGTREPPGDLAALGGSPNRFVGRLDKYIGRAFLRVLALTLLGCYVIYALIEVQGLMDSALRNERPLGLVFRYLQYFAPGVLHLVLPVSCLVGAVVAFTLLTRTGELTAIRAGGVSLRRATVPVLLVTLALCGLLFVVQDRIAPGTNRKAEEIRDLLLGRAPRTHAPALTGSWTFGPDGKHLYHYRHYDPATGTFHGFSVFTLDRKTPRIEDHRYAETARWTGTDWELGPGWYRSFHPLRYEPFDDLRTAAYAPPERFLRNQETLGFGSSNDVANEMSVKELREEIRALDASGYDATRLRVAYHGKFSHAAAPLVMVLLGLPFAFRLGRHGSLYGIGVAFLLVLVYWATLAVFNALGFETILRPLVAAWAPNVLFGILGIYLLLYVRT